MSKLDEFAINLPMTSVGAVAAPVVPELTSYDMTAADCVPADVSSEHKHIYISVDSAQVVAPNDSPAAMVDMVLSVGITNPLNGSCSYYKLVKRLSFDKVKIACQAERETPVQIVEAEEQPEDELLVEQEMQRFYAVQRVQEMAGIYEAVGDGTAKVLISYDDDKANRATAVLTIKDVKDKAHARHVFKSKHASKYSNPKITRVTMVEAKKD